MFLDFDAVMKACANANIARVVLTIAIFLTLFSCLAGIYGIPWSSVRENSQEVKTVFVQARQAFIAALAAMLVWFGILTKHTAISWLGTMVLAAFSVLFFFGIGLLYVPWVVVLSILLALLGRRRRRTA